MKCPCQMNFNNKLKIKILKVHTAQGQIQSISFKQ